MNRGTQGSVGWVAPLIAVVAVGSPIASHVALAFGRFYGFALLLAGAQSLAGGALLWRALPRHRWLGAVASGVLLAALGLGARGSPEQGLMAAAGVSHAMLYTALLVVFGATLRPGRMALATGLASRLNPRFHAGMIPYTRAVTLAWCVFFGLQLAGSAVLLAIDPAVWRVFVTTLHAPLALAMLVAEFLVRRWRWRHEHYTGFVDTVRGVLAQRRASSGRARSETMR